MWFITVNYKFNNLKMKPSGSTRKLETPKMTAFVASLLSSESKSKLNNT